MTNAEDGRMVAQRIPLDGRSLNGERAGQGMAW